MNSISDCAKHFKIARSTVNNWALKCKSFLFEGLRVSRCAYLLRNAVYRFVALWLNSTIFDSSHPQISPLSHEVWNLPGYAISVRKYMEGTLPLSSYSSIDRAWYC